MAVKLYEKINNIRTYMCDYDSEVDDAPTNTKNRPTDGCVETFSQLLSAEGGVWLFNKAENKWKPY